MAHSTLNLLFICSRNRLRSPTGEALYSSLDGVAAASAGTAPDAEEGVSADLIEWADVIFAMESRHKKTLLKTFPQAMKEKRVLTLNIKDDYDFMDPELCSMLRKRVDSLLGIDSAATLSDSHHKKPIM